MAGALGHTAQPGGGAEQGRPCRVSRPHQALSLLLSSKMPVTLMPCRLRDSGALGSQFSKLPECSKVSGDSESDVPYCVRSSDLARDARGRSGTLCFFPLCSLLLPPPTCSLLWLALFLPQKPGDKSRGSGCRGRTRGGKEGRRGGGWERPGDCSGCQRAEPGGSPSGPCGQYFSGDSSARPTQSAGEGRRAAVGCL